MVEETGRRGNGMVSNIDSIVLDHLEDQKKLRGKLLVILQGVDENIARTEQTLEQMAALDGSGKAEGKPGNGRNEDRPMAGSLEYQLIREIKGCRTQESALRLLAQRNGGVVQLDDAARKLKIAGKSSAEQRDLENNLRHLANKIPGWEAIDQNQVRLMAEAPEGTDGTGADRQQADAMPGTFDAEAENTGRETHQDDTPPDQEGALKEDSAT